ncbi:MAG: arginase family protein, partial [Desulfurococcaceae archaeon]
YISIDFDAFDPSYAPGVSNPEPLGITPRKLLKVLKELILSNELRVAGFDVVEVNPLKDPSDITSILAAKMIVEMSSLELARSTLNTA